MPIDLPHHHPDAPEEPRRPRFKRYRIGDFARFMGVGPDYLKHYERQGILTSEIRDNGYRYFPFNQSATILEAMRLQGCGFTVREMGPMIYERTGAEAADALRDVRASLEAKIRREEAVLAEVKKQEAWLRERFEKPDEWEIRRSEGFYFLLHANGTDFIKDERIYDILPAWMEGMPIVKSALRFTPSACAFGDEGAEPPPLDDFFRKNAVWGMLVGKSAVKQLGLPLNDVVEYFPAGRRFVHHFGGCGALDAMASLADGTHRLYRAMREVNQRPAGMAAADGADGTAAGGTCFMEIRMTARRNLDREAYGLFRVLLD